MKLLQYIKNKKHVQQMAFNTLRNIVVITTMLTVAFIVVLSLIGLAILGCFTVKVMLYEH